MTELMATRGACETLAWGQSCRLPGLQPRLPLLGKVGGPPPHHDAFLDHLLVVTVARLDLSSLDFSLHGEHAILRPQFCGAPELSNLSLVVSLTVLEIFPGVLLLSDINTFFNCSENFSILGIVGVILVFNLSLSYCFDLIRLLTFLFRLLF
jgi:hypothetical protein